MRSQEQILVLPLVMIGFATIVNAGKPWGRSKTGSSSRSNRNFEPLKAVCTIRNDVIDTEVCQGSILEHGFILALQTCFPEGENGIVSIFLPNGVSPTIENVGQKVIKIGRYFALLRLDDALQLEHHFTLANAAQSGKTIGWDGGRRSYWPRNLISAGDSGDTNLLQLRDEKRFRGVTKAAPFFDGSELYGLFLSIGENSIGYYASVQPHITEINNAINSARASG